MYDKDEINALAILYAVEKNPENFGLLLMALEPMIEVVVKRYPEYAEHFEDIKQSVFLSLIKSIGPDAKKRSNRENLEKGFSHKLPSTFFFYKARLYTRTAISILDTSKPMSGGQFREHHLSMGYDMYANDVISIEDLPPKQKRKLFDETDMWEMWND